MTLESVGQFTKHIRDRMQKEFDSLNKEIGLSQKYYLNTKSNEEINDKVEEITGNLIQDLDYTQISDTTQMNSLINQTEINSLIQNDSNNNSITEEESIKKVN